MARISRVSLAPAPALHSLAPTLLQATFAAVQAEWHCRHACPSGTIGCGCWRDALHRVIDGCPGGLPDPEPALPLPH